MDQVLDGVVKWLDYDEDADLVAVLATMRSPTNAEY